MERIVKNESGDNEIWEMNRDEINDNVSLLPTYIEEVCIVHLSKDVSTRIVCKYIYIYICISNNEHDEQFLSQKKLRHTLTLKVKKLVHFKS